jgi:hypothetical protein
MKKLMEDLHEADATAGALATENRRLREAHTGGDMIDYIQELLLRISSLEGIIEDLRKEVSSMRERESNRTYS